MGKIVDVEQQIRTAVKAWAQNYSDFDDIHLTELVSYVFVDEDEPERYVVVFAAREMTEWQAAEVWLENGRIASINSLGEGAPPDGVVWPWED